jgi:NUMOD3 motif
MPIVCNICNAEFPNLISSTHLKSHNMLTADYVQKYGKLSLASNEYRLKRSSQNTGTNNPNYGNILSDASKKIISEKNSGAVPWNKGVIFKDTSVQRAAVKKREENYKSGTIARYTHPTIPAEVREKISKSVSLYAKENPVEIKSRAKKSIDTKIDNGYYDKQRLLTIDKFKDKCAENEFLVLDVTDKIARLSCNSCSHEHTRSISSATHKNMCPVCSSVGTSTYEKELLAELKNIIDTNYVVSDRSVLGNLELDILMPAYKLAIEIDGLYWHSEEAGKGKFYHSYKTSKCKEAGIQLIHIFEDEWVHKRDICINRLKSKLGLCKVEYARKFKVQAITNSDAYDFLSKYHIQGRGTAASYCYGLIRDGNVYAVMTFSKLNIAKGSKHVEGKYELNRYASIDNIVGGASKLFSHFIKSVNPIEVISYSDERWNTGNLYNKLGFVKAGVTQPNYWYVKGCERIHRFKLRKTQDDARDKTEKVLRAEAGYKRIWDCGSSKWVWTNDKNLLQIDK